MNKPALALAAIAATLVSVSAASSSAGSQGASFLRLPRATATGELSQYGHVRALVKAGSAYRLRFDPAFWLGGVTASKAAAEDGVVMPGEPVPNDYYVRDESRKALTYVVPASARVTVLDSRLRSFSITPAQLAEIVKGRNPTGRRLFDRTNGLGYWALLRVDTVLSLDQQYQP